MSEIPPASLPLAGKARKSLSTVKVRARGEDYRVVQVSGHLFVCANGCCCGHTDKGRMAISTEEYERQWNERRVRNQVHLTFTGCLGPCIAGNNALLQIHGRSIWLKDLNEPEDVTRIFDYIESMLVANTVLTPPEALAGKVYERFLPPPASDFHPLVPAADDDEGGLERLDPVCLMDVDPATARHKLDYNGRTFYFCAPSCKKSFERDPESFLIG